MRIINEREMWNSITLDDMMDAVEAAYALHRSGNYRMPDRMTAVSGQDILMYMPSFSADLIGTKMLAEFPGNGVRGLPTLSGLMILNSAKTGRPLAILDGSALTAIRTGAVGGTAIRYLADPDAHRVGLIGCGVQGFTQLLYACAVRDIREISLYSAHGRDLTGFIERLRQRLDRSGIAIRVCPDAETLALNSDILITATPSADPLFPDDAELLRGKCIVAIGSWRPERRELPDAVWRLTERVYIDTPFASEESGDLRIPLASGLLTPERVCLMEDLIADAKAGNPPVLSETRCFKSVGMGLFDLTAAGMIFRKSAERGTGIELDW